MNGCGLKNVGHMRINAAGAARRVRRRDDANGWVPAWRCSGKKGPERKAFMKGCLSKKKA